MIHIVFFASVKEAAGMASLDLEADGIARVSDVISSLIESGGPLRDAVSTENLLIAVNQTMVQPNHEVGDGDEVAFFPPVTGG